MGRNGVGKTTTLKCIIGLLKADAGPHRLRRRGHHAAFAEARARRGIGYVPQGREIFPHLTVEENLHIGRIAHGSNRMSSSTAFLQLFPILKEFLPRKGGMLWGGQQQQLAIGRALLTEAEAADSR